jgi:hypothetical protein
LDNVVAKIVDWPIDTPLVYIAGDRSRQNSLREGLLRRPEGETSSTVADVQHDSVFYCSMYLGEHAIAGVENTNFMADRVSSKSS